MRPYRLGLTGSIGMGKSTTAGFFREEGVPVWDADAAVHRLYAPAGQAVVPVLARWPQARSVEGGIDRALLKAIVTDDPTALAWLEAQVHPLVAADRAAFIDHATSDLVLLDIPLLFETGSDAGMDATLVVTAPADLQRARVLARKGMTEEAFQVLLARQMPDSQKRARATHIIETLSPESARSCVQALIAYIRTRLHA